MYHIMIIHPQNSVHIFKLGLHRILIWPDIGYPAWPDTGFPAKNKFNPIKKKNNLFLNFSFFVSLNFLNFSD